MITTSVLGILLGIYCTYRFIKYHKDLNDRTNQLNMVIFSIGTAAFTAVVLASLVYLILKYLP